MSTRYSASRIQRSLIHFTLGKGVSALAGVLAMLLVIRQLSIEAFAAYSVLVALVEMLTAVSGLGLVHASLRYVPELYSKHYQVSMRTFIYWALGLRTLTLLFFVLTVYLFADQLVPLVGLGSFLLAFQVFLVVVILRTTTNFLSQILESTLHQGIVQLGFSGGTLVRLAGMVFLMNLGDVQLVNVIWVEVIGDALSLLVMVFGLLRIVETRTAEDQHAVGDSSWLRGHLQQIAKFAAAGYLQHLAVIPYGGNTNRLVGGSMLNAGSMANFGFAQSLYDYLKRYLPAQLLVGLIRPIVVARYSESGDFRAAAGLCSSVMQVNLLLILGALAMMMVGGTSALAAISGGKYGSEALLILGTLFIVLLLETQRQQLELLVQVVERYEYLIFSNVLLSTSVLLAVVLIPLVGAVAFPVANAVGLLAANFWVQRKLKFTGFHFHNDWLSTLSVVAIFLIATLVGEVAEVLILPWYLAAVATVIVYTILVYLVQGNLILRFVSTLTGQPRDSLPAFDDDTPDVPIRIAFGVLSSKESAAAIDEIAAAVFPNPVYVHHDFSKQPKFEPTAANIQVLRHPVVTEWGTWSLVEATFCLMKAAVDDPEVTHFQLLSEACLPVRPVSDFENFLANERPDAMIDILSLEDNGAMISHGWRYVLNADWSTYIAREARRWAWGPSVRFHAKCSINLLLPNPAIGLPGKFRQAVGNSILDLLTKATNQYLAQIGFEKLAIGGQWFGANRRTVRWLLAAREHCSAVTQHYQQCHIPDESYIHTLISTAKRRGLPLRIFPSNHATFWDGCGSGPDLLGMHDLDRIHATRKFFSRKFSLVHDDPLRQSVLLQINSNRDKHLQVGSTETRRI